MGKEASSVRGRSCVGWLDPSTYRRKGMEKKITQAAKQSLHQIRKRIHIGPKCRESPPPKRNLENLQVSPMEAEDLCTCSA